MKTVDIEISNVGGLAGKHMVTFKEGLNTLKAGNAVGKTSCQKAIELLALQNQDLKGAKHYANLFGDGLVTVKATGGIECDRRFRVVGNDLCEAGGEPLVNTGKGYISAICFANPENPLINQLLEGNSIKSFIERFSDSEHYDQAIEILKDVSQTIASKLSAYRDTIAKIDETEQTIELLTKDKADLDGKLRKLPKIDVSTVMKDMKAFQKAYEEKKQIMNSLSETKAALNEAKELIEDYKNAMKHLQSDLESIMKKHPKIEERLEALSLQIPNVKNIIFELDRKIKRGEDDLKLIQDNKASRTKFKDNGNLCHACGRPLTIEELQRYQDKIETDLSINRKARTKSNNELNELEGEKQELNEKEEQIGQKQDEIREKQTYLVDNENEQTRLEKKAKEKIAEEKAIQEKIKQLSKNQESFEKYQEKDRLETQLDEKEKSIEQTEKRLTSLKSDIVDVDSLQKKEAFLSEATTHMEIRRDEIVDAVRVKFNNIINDLYKKMGYKNIEDIAINPSYAISVTKKDKSGKEIEHFPLVALSASERVTLGVALLVAAKQEYLPDFPFFVIDEIVTSYDPKRFEHIKEFVKNVTDYVIITQLSKEDGLMVEHGA